MADKVDVAALAKLARLEVSAEELKKLEQEIPAILHFVETIQKAHMGKEASAPALRNVMRPDDRPYEPGEFTDKLLAAAPAQKDDRVVVKQVISRQKAAKQEARSKKHAT